MIYKILYWLFKILAISLLVIPLILFIPGFILHIISEEIDDRTKDDYEHIR